MKILASWEDDIYHTKQFINELDRVQELYFENLFKELQKEKFSNQFESEDDANESLWDYLFNDYDELIFEEYLEKFGYDVDDTPRIRTKEEIKSDIDNFFEKPKDAENWWKTYNNGLASNPKYLLNTDKGLDILEYMIKQLEDEAR